MNWPCMCMRYASSAIVCRVESVGNNRMANRTTQVFTFQALFIFEMDLGVRKRVFKNV